LAVGLLLLATNFDIGSGAFLGYLILSSAFAAGGVIAMLVAFLLEWPPSRGCTLIRHASAGSRRLMRAPRAHAVVGIDKVAEGLDFVAGHPADVGARRVASKSGSA
jgi:hypothetical protein